MNFQQIQVCESCSCQPWDGGPHPEGDPLCCGRDNKHADSSGASRTGAPAAAALVAAKTRRVPAYLHQEPGATPPPPPPPVLRQTAVRWTGWRRCTSLGTRGNVVRRFGLRVQMLSRAVFPLTCRWVGRVFGGVGLRKRKRPPLSETLSGVFPVKHSPRHQHGNTPKFTAPVLLSCPVPPPPLLQLDCIQLQAVCRDRPRCSTVWTNTDACWSSLETAGVGCTGFNL